MPARSSYLEAITGNEIRSQFDDYFNNSHGDMLEQLNSLQDPRIIKDAIANNEGLTERNSLSRSRASARFGTQKTPAQQAAIQRMSSLGESKSKVNNLNNSRLDQFDRNSKVATQLTQNRQTLRGQGMDNMLTSVGLSSQRDAQNAQSQANAQNQNTQTAMSIAAMVAMS